MAKRIVVFVSDDAKINKTLSELKTWLLSCSHFLAMIEKTLLNARLQEYAPEKEEIVVPFVSTDSRNFDSKSPRFPYLTNVK